MGVLDAFDETWSDARRTFGEGVPQGGDQFDGSSKLREIQSKVEAAAPDSRWTGSAADAYAAKNRSHAQIYGDLAALDQRTRAEVDRAAEVVAAGRRDLDSVRQKVYAAANAIPAGAQKERTLMSIVSSGSAQISEIVRRSNGDMSSIAQRLSGIRDEYQALGDKVGDSKGDSKEPGEPKRPGEPNDSKEPKDGEEHDVNSLMGDPGWQYPWEPPPPHDSAPGGGRWDIDPKPYPSGPGGGPPVGPFEPPKPWHKDLHPPIEGGPTGYQDVVGSPPNGWGVDPSWRMQENYKFRVAGETFNGAPDHVRWVQRDGNWYQAQWVDYNLEAEHMRRGVSGTGFFTPNFGMNEWHPIDIKDIYRAQADNPRLTMYIPNPYGGQVVLDNKHPTVSAP